MTTKRLLQKIVAIFSERLYRKTGWGKDEVLVILKYSIQEALIEENYMDE